MENLALFIQKFRYVILSIVLLVTLFFGYFLKDLKVDADVLGYLPEGDHAATLFQQIGEKYGGNDMVLIGIESENVFTPETLHTIKQITDSVRMVNGIGYVTSLTNVIDIKSTEFGLEIGRLIDEYDIPEDQDELKKLREYAISKEMYLGNLVSEDAKATLIIAKLLSKDDRNETVDLIRKKVGNINYEGKIYYAGMPVTLYELSKVIMQDIWLITPFAFVLICLVLFLGFRNARGVILPMLTVLIAIICTMGLISFLGYSITLITNVIPVILLAVGSAYAIHVVNRINEEMAVNPKGAVIRALTYITVPVFLASLTTVFGFLSFIAGSYLTMIQEFGIFSAIGIFFCLILSVTLIPVMITVTSKNENFTNNKKPSNRILEATTLWLNNLVFNHRKALLFIWAIILLLSIFGITRVERRVDLVDYFKKDNIVQENETLLREKFSGSMPVYLKVKGDVQNPKVLRVMEKAGDFMESFTFIQFSQSVADLVKDMNDAMGEGKLIPDDEAKIRQLWFLLDGQEIMEQLVSYELDEGLIIGQVNNSDLVTLNQIETEFTEFVKENSNDIHTLEYTGIPLMLKRLDNSIIKSQFLSLTIAVLLVMVLVSILQRSIIKGILSIIPVFVTLLALFGVMGLTGIPLDIATVLSGSVTIGIGIDYAIHFITHFGVVYKKTNIISTSISDAIKISGRAIIINMLSVTIGFAVLSFSNLVPLQRFGILLATTMLVSGLAALTLLPVALLIAGENLKKVFRVNSVL
ncbi:MAG: MMPL family transporter [Lentimicrobium sp.]|nr:MMPL family transporter [Lentimicrobium sp.]